jgi:hypothetical protein
VICYHADSSRTAGMNWLTLMIDARLAIFAKNYPNPFCQRKAYSSQRSTHGNYGDEALSSFLRET